MIPRSPDLAIFVLTDRQMDKTDCFTPCACAWGNDVVKNSRQWEGRLYLLLMVDSNEVAGVLKHNSSRLSLIRMGL